MPEETTTVWTCTRCKTQIPLVHNPRTPDKTQPQDWIRVHFTIPPRASHDPARSLGDLCDPCGGLLMDFLAGKDLPESMARALELSRIDAWAQENVDLAERNLRLAQALRDCGVLDETIETIASGTA